MFDLHMADSCMDASLVVSQSENSKNNFTPNRHEHCLTMLTASMRGMVCTPGKVYESPQNLWASAVLWCAGGLCTTTYTKLQTQAVSHPISTLNIIKMSFMVLQMTGGLRRSIMSTVCNVLPLAASIPMVSAQNLRHSYSSVPDAEAQRLGVSTYCVE